MSTRSSPEMAGRAAPSSSELDAVFGALAHRARRQILVSLQARGGVMTAGEIADRFKHSWPTTTRHLGVLHSAGLLEVGKEGRHRYYSITPGVLARSAKWMMASATEPSPRKSWADLPFARMRNAIPPRGDRDG